MDYILPYAYRVYKVKPPIMGWGAPPHAFLNFQIPVEVTSILNLVSVALDMAERTKGGEIRRQTMVTPKKPTPTLVSHPPRLHTIQRGDTLFGLAKQKYGDPAKLGRIVEVNPFLNGLLGHQQLPVGTMILLP